MKKKLIVIAGPTACGKTLLSVALAKQLNTIIISADSRQFYKEISIGTAKPTFEEMNGVKHYFINSHSIHSPLSVAQYVHQALPIIHQEFESQEHLILTGGSGMFIDALCYGLDDIPHSDELRQQLTEHVRLEGTNLLLEELLARDPSYFHEVDKQNPARIIRAIEVIRLTNKTYTELRQNSTKNAINLHPFEIHYFVIHHEREVLYERINRRVENMIQQGLIDEAKNLFPHKNLQSLNTVGYSELFDYFEGKSSLEEAIHLIKQNSRRYAKRQITWFKRNNKAQWINFSTNEAMISSILQSMS